MFHYLKRLLLFIFLAFPGAAVSQNFTFPAITKAGTTIQDFVPNGWQVSDSVRGDLNGNRLNDYAIVLIKRDSVSLPVRVENSHIYVRCRPRILIVLLYDTSSEKLLLSDQNNKIIPPLGIDKYQFNSIEIDNKALKLSIVIYFGPAAHETVSYIFRHQNEKTVLIGADTDYFNETIRRYETCSFNFLTKKWWVSQGDNGDSDSRNDEVWHTLEVERLRPLSIFQGPLTWSVTKNQRL